MGLLPKIFKIESGLSKPNVPCPTPLLSSEKLGLSTLIGLSMFTPLVPPKILIPASAFSPFSFRFSFTTALAPKLIQSTLGPLSCWLPKSIKTTNLNLEDSFLEIPAF
ncbi:hypothetical protein ES332_A07G189900v1 [Gossypium tomentosum]|uniref:Uncharacterized protein n=1 Tax=Gossypium tomentosum TaxID=34277 RepID=A0A5D2PV60_GOSTO|nr:hypothetical protein ES332_A07G189900v1 [Gossypium tomentosum]